MERENLKDHDKWKERKKVNDDVLRLGGDWNQCTYGEANLVWKRETT